MEQTTEVSIIIPVYNVEKYLRKCLDSVIDQTFSAWECIVVDDGTPDNSGKICDEFAQRDSRFRVFHTQNQGVSAARNKGIREARGKYISFIDSDDWVEPTFIEKLYRLIVDNDADVAQVGMIREFAGFTRPLTYIGGTRILTGIQPYAELVKDSTVRSYSCNKIFRSSIVSDGFPVGRRYEDIYAHSMWFVNVRRMVLSSAMLYHYRMRGSSFLNSNVSRTRQEQFEVCLHRAGMMKLVDPDLFSDNYINAYLTREAVNCAKIIARREPDRDVRLEAVKGISRQLNEIPELKKKNLGFKLWLRSRMLRNSPALFIKRMRLAYALQFGMKRRATHLYE